MPVNQAVFHGMTEACEHSSNLFKGERSVAWGPIIALGAQERNISDGHAIGNPLGPIEFVEDLINK